MENMVYGIYVCDWSHGLVACSVVTFASVGVSRLMLLRCLHDISPKYSRGILHDFAIVTNREPYRSIVGPSPFLDLCSQIDVSSSSTRIHQSS